MKQNEKLILVLVAFSFLAVFVLAQAALAFFGCIGPSCYPDTKQGTAACEQLCENVDDYAGCMDDCQSGVDEPVEDVPYAGDCSAECANVPDAEWVQCMTNCLTQ